MRGISGKTNVPIAAAITAYSRIILNKYKLLALQKGFNIYYSDTDSLVLNGPLPPEVCDSTKLGMLKLENKFTEGIFVIPKVYYLELGDGSTITKCKGYSGKLSKSQYITLLEGNFLELQVTKWIRSLKGGSVEIKKGVPYQLNPIFRKRQKVLDSNGKWIDTKPLIINNRS